jgi:uncharacterized protein YoxC
MDPIHDLLTFEKQLIAWIFAATPTTDDERASLTKLLALRDRISSAIDDLVLERLQIAAHGPTEETKKLQALTQDIQAETKTITTIAKAIDYAGQALKLAAAIGAAVA